MTASSSSPTQIDTLIVGAGPVGLAAAVKMSQNGARIRIIDAAPSGASTSRAAVIHARTLDLLADIGLATRMLEEGIIVPDFTVRARNTKLAHIDFRGLRTPFPFTLMLSQARTEELLASALSDTGCGIDREVAFESFESTSSGRVAVLRRGDGTRETVDARFVIGADGGHSRVRQQLGIAFEGAEYSDSFVLADVSMVWPLAPTEVQLFLAEQGLMVVAPLPGGQHRIVATVDDAPARPTVTDIQHLLDERGPGQTTVHSLDWSSRFRVAHRLAASYRQGNAFLAGDAAHVHSPAGGQGMNLGIQDAVDLGGHLLDVLSGTRNEDTLAEYELIRRPAAVKVIGFTDRMTRMATLRTPVLRHLRDAAIRTVLHSPRRQTRLARRLAQLQD
ncbi:FAD-dependent oxidoreductase [Dietzia sp. PP-33]|jgi:2-polyprenyl-6-methoxyphenol hydroxylase-like FAD-dependent oxidoreductase|uniref:FAD-dependent oxidoreductase n=1 Tax=Dietzia sp. PP-33 TaxID=2957500 RepID=UPI0029A8D950|nr:FAD-dependent monooxygenase [Dietzia sp. PP-33]MDX2355292.1 FAD-dependent monooxygenase [Dietzia sp. PP-33]